MNGQERIFQTSATVHTFCEKTFYEKLYQIKISVIYSVKIVNAILKQTLFLPDFSQTKQP
jgi:hypothetical protein